MQNRFDLTRRQLARVLGVIPSLCLAHCSSANTGPSDISQATQLVFQVQPVRATAGAAIPVTVIVADASGAVVTSATTPVSITLKNNPTSAALSGSATVNAVNGVATFATLHVDQADSGYTFAASAAGLGGATSTKFTVMPGAPASLTFAVQPRLTTGGANFTPGVQLSIRDAFGNTTTNASPTVTMAIAANPNHGALTGTTSLPAIAGIATFASLSVDSAGRGYTLAASGAGLTGAVSDTFTVVAPLKFTMISAGKTHACGITASGAAYCWGDGTFGELGIGDMSGLPRCVAEPGPCSPTPVLVGGGLTFQSVSAGSSHSCGVTTTGQAYCWGLNSDAQLGDGTTTERDTPVPVAGGLVFSVVSTGDYTTCGLTAGGAAFCWGSNFDDALGSGQSQNMLFSSTTPVAVAGGLTFSSLTEGSRSACGVTVGSQGYCWGSNSSGQLGDSMTLGSSTPALVSGGLSFTMISTGVSGTACGITTTSAAYCWGYSPNGELGNGQINTSSNVPVPVGGGLSFSTISSGWGTVCGTTTGHDAYCWGSNYNGELGNDSVSLSAHAPPSLVLGSHPFIAVSAGTLFTCGLVTGGTAYCWGLNDHAQLGNGTTTNSTVPVAISAPSIPPSSSLKGR